MGHRKLMPKGQGIQAVQMSVIKDLPQDLNLIQGQELQAHSTQQIILLQEPDQLIQDQTQFQPIQGQLHHHITGQTAGQTLQTPEADRAHPLEVQQVQELQVIQVQEAGLLALEADLLAREADHHQVLQADHPAQAEGLQVQVEDQAQDADNIYM